MRTITCDHEDIRTCAHAGVRVRRCNECAEITFSDADGPLEPGAAVTRLFGEFDLVGSLDAVGAPGREVLLYTAPDLLVGAALRVLEPHRWARAGEELWVSHDGEHLLLAHDHPSASHLVGA